MKQADVITKYLEACRSGQSEAQAELFARSWAEASEIHPEAATKHDLELAVERLNGSISKLSFVLYSIGIIIVGDIVKRWLS